MLAIPIFWGEKRQGAFSECRCRRWQGGKFGRHRPIVAKSDAILVEPGRSRANVDQTGQGRLQPARTPNLGRLRWVSGRNQFCLPKSARHRPTSAKSGRIQPICDQSRPGLPNADRESDRLRRCWSNFGRTPPHLGQHLAGSSGLSFSDPEFEQRGSGHWTSKSGEVGGDRPDLDESF